MTGIGLISYQLNNFYRAARRWYLFKFRPEYVEKMKRLRSGGCPPPSECNCCYLMVRLNPCEHATKEGCAVNGTQPYMCKVTPIDEKDKSIIQRRLNCRIYWKGKE